MKKFVVITLALILAFALSAPALASSITYTPSIFWMDGKAANEHDDPGIELGNADIGPFIFAFYKPTGVNIGEFDFSAGNPTAITIRYARVEADHGEDARIGLYYGPDKNNLTFMSSFIVKPTATANGWSDFEYNTYALSGTWPTGVQKIWIFNDSDDNPDAWRTGVNIAGVEITYGEGVPPAPPTGVSFLLIPALGALVLGTSGVIFIGRKLKK